VKLIQDTDEPATSKTIGRGAPFYYSWSPDGTRMLWQRNNQQMDIFDVEQDAIVETLTQRPGNFFSPAWSPVDDRLLFGALNAEGDATDLIIVAGGQTKILAPGLNGPVSFAWSPDGNRVAYTDGQGPLFVLDAVTGETVMGSSVTGVLAFYWSPDSESIAYLTLAISPGTFSASAGGVNVARAQTPEGLVWSVMDVQAGTTRRYTSFVPTQEMIYMLRFFDQFAQSHRVWSPDSRHLLYSEITSDNRPSISVLDVTRADTVPLTIAEGVLGVWSFR
jgi:TolB protein